MSETSKDSRELNCSELDRVAGGSFVESFKDALSGGAKEVTANKGLDMGRDFRAFEAWARG